MEKFTIEGMKKVVKEELRMVREDKSSELKIFEFFSEDLNTFGGMVVDDRSRAGSITGYLPSDVLRLIRKNGATNAIFFLKIGAWELNDGVWGYKGWICWNSVKIPVKGRSGFQTLLSAYREGTERLFGVVEEARIALKLKNMAAKRIQKLGIEFESKE